MKKTTLTFIIVISALFGLILSVFLSGFIAAKLSQITWLAKYNIINPQAPIVINRRETVRANDGTDILDAINTAKQRLASVVAISNGQTIRTGNALNVTSDGSFVTVASSFSQANATFAVILVDGRIAPVGERVTDPATGLVFFKATASNMPVVNFANSKELLVGQRVVSIEQTMKSFTPNAYPAFVSSSQTELAEKQFEASVLGRTFGVQQDRQSAPGAAIVNLSGDVVGIWDGTRIVPSDIIKRAVNLYLSNQIVRPAFGFAYEVISSSKAKLLGIAEGGRVLRVVKASSADKAGLAVGDIITIVGDKTVTDEVSLEELLETLVPGEIVPFTVSRGQQTLILNITSAELK
jgi:S1-C subfamily serine protease